MRILRLKKSRRGSAGITYGLAVGLIAVVAITAAQQVGGAISGVTDSAAGKIKEVDPAAGKIKEVSGGTCPVVTFTCDGATSDPVDRAFVGDSATIYVRGRGTQRAAGEAECKPAGWAVVQGYNCALIQ